MDKCSNFIKNGLFGSYPNQSSVNEYENLGVRYFIDLTESGEKNIVRYNTKYTYINYPIQDRHVPSCWKSFSELIIKITNIIKNLEKYEKIYIHCKGGHGRSGILVACLLCYLYKITPAEAIAKTTIYHNKRKIMKEKWRKMGSPQTRKQKKFVTKFFEPLYIYKNYSNYFTSFFNNDADIKVKIPGFGIFPTANAAFQAFKDPYNNEYVGRLESSRDKKEIDDIISKCNQRHDWDDIKDSIMLNVLKHKFDQHNNIRENLLQTGLRPFIILSNDMYWGRNNTSGKNVFGKILGQVRNNLYITG